ncbi:uncharacterized protein [Panulirus ornatus]|uniref:uncharacterized protein n=1 Tax=Panulirus ornatus TaxID=150431 RepID=UPI003A836D97
MTFCWTSTKSKRYLFTILVLIHGLHQGIKGEISQRHNIKNHTNAVPENGLSLSSRRMFLTRPKTPNAERLEQESGIMDYSGWRVLRLFPPKGASVNKVLQALESSHGVVVLRMIREESRMAVDVAMSPDTSLTRLLAPTTRHNQGRHHYRHKDNNTRRNRRTEDGGELGKDGGGGYVGHAEGMDADEDPARGERRRRDLLGGLLEWRIILDDVVDHLLIRPTPQLTGSEPLAWDDYYRFPSISTFARALARRYPTVECLTLGKTVEGRPLLALIFATDARRMAKLYKRRLMKVRRTMAGGGGQQDPTSVSETTMLEEPARGDRGKGEHTRRVATENDLEGTPANVRASRKFHSRRRKSAKTKRIIFIEAGSHAREWISPAVATYVGQQLADAGKVFLKHVSFIIAPVANPDGYEFSHTNDRLWRKNRRSNGIFSCSGVDLNRNWDKAWGEEGGSDNPCSFMYQGSEAFSEVETRTLGELVWVFKKKVKLFISLHSFGEYILYPWGYTMDKPNKRGRLKHMAKTIMEQLNQNKSAHYKYGQSSELMYLASGCADDYMYDLGVPYSYTIELPKDSFILPPEDILPVAQDFWDAMVCVAGEIVRNKRAKSFCNKRIVKVEGFGNRTLKAWVNKKVSLKEAEDIVRMRYMAREMRMPEVRRAKQKGSQPQAQSPGTRR